MQPVETSLYNCVLNFTNSPPVKFGLILGGFQKSFYFY